MTDKPKTWKEAKALGWKRCCAVFSGRKPDGTYVPRQCKNRATEDHETWCKKHAYVGKTIRDMHEAAEDACRKQAEAENKDPNDWDDDEDYR